MALMTKPLPPKGHCHYHRPVISFKEQPLVKLEPLAVSSALTATSNLALQTALNFGKLLTAYRSPLTPRFRVAQWPLRLPRQRMNQDPSLRVHRRLLTVVVRSVKELAPGRIHRGQERQPLFDGFPFRHRINAHAFTRQTGHIKRRTVFLFNVTPEKGRDFQPALGIYSCSVVAS